MADIIPTVTIDDVFVLTGVSSCEVERPEADAMRGGEGGEVTTLRRLGHKVHITVGGDDGMTEANYTALVNAWGELVKHKVTLTYPGSSLPAQTYEVNWRQGPPLRIKVPGYIASISFTLTERTAAA